MKPPRFVYHAPTSLAEAIALLAEKPNARVLAGGQTLMPMLNMRLIHPGHLIDLNGIGALAYVRRDGAAVAIGAMTRQRALERSPLVAEALPLMAEAIRCIGHPQTRNRGTIGGSLCHLDPSAELPTVAMAFDATVAILGAAGARSLPFAQFPQGILSTVLAEGELLIELRFMPWPAGHGYAFVEYARRKGDFAVVSAAAMIDADVEGKVRRLSLTLGGVAAAPVRLTAVERRFLGQPLAVEALAQAASAAAGAVDALQDPTYPQWYRQHLATGLIARAVATAGARLRCKEGEE